MNDMQNEIMLLKQRIDELESKLDICCGDMDKATRKIQRFTRGHQSRKDTKIMKRGKQPNITDALLDMPKDVGDLITTQRNKIPKITKGWTKIIGANSFAGKYNELVQPSIEAGKALSDSSGGRIGGFDHAGRDGGPVWPRERTHNEMIQKLERADGTTFHTPTDLYISPGASMKLLREKEEEGFEIEYDPTDNTPGAALKKKKTNKKKKKKRK
jgi:hypothetical protein